MPHLPYQMGYLMSSSNSPPELPLRQAEPVPPSTDIHADTPKNVLADPMPSFPSQDTVTYSLVGDARLAPSPDDTNPPPPIPGDPNDSNLSHPLGAETAPDRPHAGDTAVVDMGDQRWRYSLGKEDASEGGSPSPSLPPRDTAGEGRQLAAVRLPAPSPITAGPDDPARGVQLLSASDDSVASAERTLSYLSEELSLIVTGYSHYYMGSRDLALQKYSAVSIEAPLLRRAISIVTALLDLGVQNETSGAEVGLTTGSWFRLARLAMAAIMRGTNRSEGLEKAGDIKLKPCLDVFHIHEQLTVPETEIESLRMMAEQLAGKLKGERGLGGGDGNPETVYDAIISKRMANFEARAEAEEWLKAADWTVALRIRLEGEEFDTFLHSLQTEMEGHEYTIEVRRNFMDNLLNLWTKRREAILRDVEAQFREEARLCKEDERCRLKEQLMEEGRVEARRGAEAELTVWKQAHLQDLKNNALPTLQHEALKVNDGTIEEWRLGELAEEKERLLEAAKANIDEHVKKHYEALKTEALDNLRLQARRDAGSRSQTRKTQHEQTIQRALREESRPLLLKVARELGMAISAEDSTALIAAAPPRPEGTNKGTKRKTSDQQGAPSPAAPQGQSHQARAAKVAGIYGGEVRTPSTASNTTRNPDGLPEMESALALPAAFADEEVRGSGSSIFNPANEMPVDETPPPPPELEAPPGPASPQITDAADFFATALGGLSAEQQFMLTAIQRLIEPVTERLFVVERKLTAQEQQGTPAPNQGAPPPQPAPTVVAPIRTAVNPAGGDDGIIPVRANTWAAAAKAPARGHRSERRGGGARAHPSRSRLCKARLSISANALDNRSHDPPDGGFLDNRREADLRGRHPQTIVMEVRTLLEKSTRNPVKVLGGRWSSNYQKTGNFIFVLAGDVPVEVLSSFEKWLCAPFPGGTLVPTKGWTWAQMRGVPTSDGTGRIWEMDELLKEACSNLVLGNAFICSAPRWQIEPVKIHSETATVLIAYADPKGEVTRQALTEGIWMFGSQVKFVRAGNKPTLIQCGRCHELGHNRSSRLLAGTCDCRLKCILCGKAGHNARSRDCSKHGDFAPPHLARNPNTETNAGTTTRADDQGFVTVNRSRPRARRVLPGATPAQGNDDIEAMMAAGRNRADMRAQARVGDNPPVDGPFPVTGLRDEPTQNPRQQDAARRAEAQARDMDWGSSMRVAQISNPDVTHAGSDGQIVPPATPHNPPNV
ncbi:hypothetical protein EDB85DRAFT_1896590 [Lactarius pseudohatsudake]|nr:hypothetical protein EDB85DRAFT_1896590 [Lactarius pseudohatsudake]